MRGLRKVPKPSRGRRFKASVDEKALSATRSRPCLLRGKRCTLLVWIGVHPNKVQQPVQYRHECTWPPEAHHVVSKARGGHDAQTVPLCRYAHQELHDIGQKAWEERWDVSLAVEQAKVWAEYQRKKGA